MLVRVFVRSQVTQDMSGEWQSIPVEGYVQFNPLHVVYVNENDGEVRVTTGDSFFVEKSDISYLTEASVVTYAEN